MEKIKASLLLFVMLSFGSTATFAADSDLKKSFTDSELIQIIKDEGYSAVKKINDGTIQIKIDGRSYVLFNKSDGDIQAYYAMSGVKISYKNINEWNKTKRLSRAYLDSSKDPVLESDLLSDGGLAKKQIVAFFNVFKGSVRAFRAFILEKDAS